MLVKEYAESVDLSVAEILKKCSSLGIDVKSGDDILSDDDIINLDYATNLISTESDSTYEEEDSMDGLVEDLVSTVSVKNDGVKKQKLKKKSDLENSAKEFINKRKEMYKHKEKLKTNKEDENIILYKEGMTVSDLANLLNISGTDIISKLISYGTMLNLNQPISFENAEIIALDYNKTLKKEETQDITNFEEFEIVDDEKDLVQRPPVVTIMGHVDHGKTTLLDYIRNSKIVDTESGGITQAIGAYQIKHNDSLITFIDTPGHAAFTEMRARGASVTDIVIIIVAADDGVMPQTVEAIDHAKSANVPIIVAINKIDKPNINIERVTEQLSSYGLTPEAWGGDIPFVNISAYTGEGVDLLLETILTISEVENLKANPNRYAMGSVIESKVDKKVGGVVSLLIQNGTLRIGDPIVVGTCFGKVRTMNNDRGVSLVEAGPSTPVEITGLNGKPSAGDKFMAFESESVAKDVAEKRDIALKEKNNSKNAMSLDDLFNQIKSGQKEINVVLKADVRGSEEAVRSALTKIDVEGVRVNVIRSGIGTITESDVTLASASNAIIIGFNVIATNNTAEVAKEYNVEIRCYTIIYKVIEDIELAMKGMLEPTFEEKTLGNAEIRQIFTFSKVGKIAGSYVTDGSIIQNKKARVIRDGVIIYDGSIASIQRGKESAKEVKKGFECGITLENYSDIKEGDIISCYEMVEVKE